MTLKQYTALRIVIAMVLAAFISSSIVRHEYFWPVIALICSMIFLFAVRSRVAEILADERDHAIGGRAARWAIQLFCLITVLMMFVFLWQGEREPQMTVVAQVLAYAVCTLMLLYALIFKILARSGTPRP